MLYHVVRRVQQAGLPAMVATTDLEADLAIFNWCQRYGIRCVRGSSEDVLDRFMMAARQAEPSPDCIVRVTSDCPMADPRFISGALGLFVGHKGSCDYATNTHPASLPDGLDVEVFSRAALEWAWEHATKAWDREHVTPLIRKNLSAAHISYRPPPWASIDPTSLRWTVDYPQDLELVRRIFDLLGNDFCYPDALRLVMEHPELQSLNSGFEGWKERPE
jgi:spore coat polysaccharide biosynthesis protein SpsF (cytidylyltransferase family)